MSKSSAGPPTASNRRVGVRVRVVRMVDAGEIRSRQVVAHELLRDRRSEHGARHAAEQAARDHAAEAKAAGRRHRAERPLQRSGLADFGPRRVTRERLRIGEDRRRIALAFGAAALQLLQHCASLLRRQARECLGVRLLDRFGRRRPEHVPIAGDRLLVVGGGRNGRLGGAPPKMRSKRPMASLRVDGSATAELEANPARDKRRTRWTAESRRRFGDARTIRFPAHDRGGAMNYRHDPDGTRLPIKLDTTTNGEFAPIPLEPVHRHARQLALEAATSHARATRPVPPRVPGVGLRRRDDAARHERRVRRAPDAAAATTSSTPTPRSICSWRARRWTRGEFIFDVQGHFVNPTGAWTQDLPPSAQPLRLRHEQELRGGTGPGPRVPACLDSDAFIKDVFLDSDTDLVVLSFVPSTRKGEPLTIEEAAATARIVERCKARTGC